MRTPVQFILINGAPMEVKHEAGEVNLEDGAQMPQHKPRNGHE